MVHGYAKTFEEINNRFKEIGYNPLAGQIAIDELVRSLTPDETILNVVEGSLQNSLGVIIATEKRIFYIGVNKHKKSIFQQFGYDEVLSVQSRQKLYVSLELQLMIKDQEPIIIRGCEKERVQEFVELVKLLTKNNN